ncbi:MAG TPA: hypothetical protein VEX62_01485 [Candidatus Limnocylindrales bacterium]|nr:hypothetical protein [Candidatus Limnocylindrales bacterium]
MRRIEEALAAWRDAQRRLDVSTDGELDALKAEVEEHRQRFQHLSAEYMMERIDALKETEARRKSATPSTPPYHEAARQEMEIASEIWGMARVSDEDVPGARTDEPDKGERGSV